MGPALKFPESHRSADPFFWPPRPTQRGPLWTERADAIHGTGDMDGKAVWLRVLKAGRALQEREPCARVVAKCVGRALRTRSKSALSKW